MPLICKDSRRTDTVSAQRRFGYDTGSDPVTEM
jgi:hypothetical protein